MQLAMSRVLSAWRSLRVQLLRNVRHLDGQSSRGSSTVSRQQQQQKE
jgi:hypothetical protein